MPSKALAKVDYEALAEVRYRLRKFMRFSEDTTREMGSTPLHYQAMLVIKGFPNREYSTVRELAEQLSIAPHSASELATRLEKEGLLRRQRSAVDRREVHLQLTPAGDHKLQQLAIAHIEEYNSFGPVVRQILEDLRGFKAGPPASNGKTSAAGASAKRRGATGRRAGSQA